ncbi:RNB domain-containing ribonuclease [Leptolyngbya sp. FACHB-321]|uniref:RNB domain-containing ribonuclease n=1 Tax=Leptolyngbya sp. FACHB-321 TaxID=2692807 RepID=UPI001685CC88|nr:RNB domain-containing ribonuclease [Leptolyngbya sp. FACHB-321]MBD2034263.1 RNB domain-containing ribonuclease [Leptolyngbya sp. FACHB-321]
MVSNARPFMMARVTSFTIDGASSTDLDDAVWVETEGNNTRLQVHIADVARKVKQDGFLDRQALKRGETAYLSTTRKPMFPPSLEASMSLLPFVERPVLTVGILVDLQGELLDMSPREQVLVSQEQFSYDAVEGILRGAPHHLQPELQLLEQVTRQLAQQWQQQGAIYGRTVGTNYIDEDGRVVAQILRSQQINAELMILTNRVVSEFMHDHQHCWLYRSHDYRDLNELPVDRQQFMQALKAIAGNPMSLQVMNLIRTHWHSTPTVEFKEQSTPAGWAVLCVVNQEGKERCPPAWSIAPRKVLAQQDSAYRWLEAWVWKKLVSSTAAQLPETAAPLPVELVRPAPETLLAAN